MYISEKTRQGFLGMPRRIHGGGIGELLIDVKTYNLLVRAGTTRVGDLKARLEKHESLRMIPGIGPKRESELRMALDIYDETQLPLEDPVLRAAAATLAAMDATERLLDMLKLSADSEWSEWNGRVLEFVQEIMLPKVRQADLSEKTLVAEARQVLKAVA